MAMHSTLGGAFAALRRYWFPVAVSLLLTANSLVIVLLVSRPPAHADHSFGGGDCWRTGTPLVCQASYLPGHSYFWNISEFWAPGSSIRGNADPGFDAAKSVWTSAPGPQVFSSGTPANSLYVQEYPYLAPACEPNGCLSSNWAAVTFNWTWNPSTGNYEYCYLTNHVCLIYWSEIYVNANWCGSPLSTSIYQYVYAHELGHVLGLADHPGSSAPNILMSNYWPGCSGPQTTARAPTSTDIGASPACSSPDGIRCIYNW